MAIKDLVRRHTLPEPSPESTGNERQIVSARIRLSALSRLEALSERFGVKKSSLAAELLEAAIDEAWEETVK